MNVDCAITSQMLSPNRFQRAPNGEVASRQVNNAFPLLTGAMIKIAISLIKTYSFERNHVITRTSQMKKEFEMHCNVGNAMQCLQNEIYC